MITVNVTIDRDKRECSLTVKGHAGQAAVGQDIICASASMLTFTIAQVIKTLDINAELEDTPTLDLESGDTIVSCRAATDEVFAYLYHAFHTILTGYRLLAHNYPQFVEIIDDKAE